MAVMPFPVDVASRFLCAPPCDERIPDREETRTIHGLPFLNWPASAGLAVLSAVDGHD